MIFNEIQRTNALMIITLIIMLIILRVMAFLPKLRRYNNVTQQNDERCDYYEVITLIGNVITLLFVPLMIAVALCFLCIIA